MEVRDDWGLMLDLGLRTHSAGRREQSILDAGALKPLVEVADTREGIAQREACRTIASLAAKRTKLHAGYMLLTVYLPSRICRKGLFRGW